MGRAGRVAAERGAHPARRLQLRRSPRHRHRGHLRPARGPAHGRPQARQDLAGRRRPLGAARRHVRLRPEQAARAQHPVHGHHPPRAAGRRDRHDARRDAGSSASRRREGPSPAPTSPSRGRCSTQRRTSVPRSACASTSRRMPRRSSRWTLSSTACRASRPPSQPGVGWRPLPTGRSAAARRPCGPRRCPRSWRARCASARSRTTGEAGSGSRRACARAGTS